jgi:aminoglycoside 6'-N-acetyltransferase
VVLRGTRVTLRPVTAEDVARLEAIRREPEVAAWWGVLDEGEIEECVGDETWFAVEVGGEVVGAVQYSEEEEPMYRHAGIDLFLSASAQRQGLGTEAIRILARHLIDERGHHRLTIDPAAENHVAIRAYEKVGFSRVGVMRSYERGPDGTWHDGVLMELLAGELRD